jgi:hypothetical protein
VARGANAGARAQPAPVFAFAKITRMSTALCLTSLSLGPVRAKNLAQITRALENYPQTRPRLAHISTNSVRTARLPRLRCIPVEAQLHSDDCDTFPLQDAPSVAAPKSAPRTETEGRC